MDTQDRDTHFAGFAKALLDEIQAEYGGYVDVTPALPQLQTLIAHCAYDLVLYALDTMNPISLQCYETTEEIIAREIPDMTELPSPE